MENVMCSSVSTDKGGDDFVILMMCANPHRRIDRECCWDKNFTTVIVNRMRKNLDPKGNKHYGSVGQYMGVGSTAKYTCEDGFSIGEFSRKKRITQTEFDELKDVIKSDLTFSGNVLNSIIKNITQAGQGINCELINVSMDIGKSDHVIAPLYEGMVTAFICRNAQTRRMHCERDCSYTLIAIPHCIGDINKRGSYVFQFQCNTEKIINVKLFPGTVLYYTGNGIMHRQISLKDRGRGIYDFNFWNLSSYSNSAFFYKSISSFRKQYNK